MSETSILGPAAAATLDNATRLRRAIASMATSVTLITTVHEGRRFGFTANSFAFVSTEPPLVTVFLSNTANCYGAFEATDKVAVNILGSDQGHIAKHFASKGEDKFAQVDVDPGFDAHAVIPGTSSTLLGAVDQRWVTGDHLMLLISVEDVMLGEVPPLVYQNRDFRKLV